MNKRDETHSAAGEGHVTNTDNADGRNDVVICYADLAPKIWLEVLPSKCGTVLAALLTNILTEGLTADQQNILGNFISAVGALISYKASRDEQDEKNKGCRDLNNNKK